MKQRELRVPLEFISFAFVKGKMYNHYQNKGTFVVPSHGKAWGNDVVYGALFLVNDFHFHIRSLDAYHSCSLSVLMRNHTNDLHHRKIVQAVPIAFRDVDTFCSLRYTEKEPIRAFTYEANPTHPIVQKKLIPRARITDGVSKPHYKELIREVLT